MTECVTGQPRLICCVKNTQLVVKDKGRDDTKIILCHGVLMDTKNCPIWNVLVFSTESVNQYLHDNYSGLTFPQKAFELKKLTGCGVYRVLIRPLHVPVNVRTFGTEH